MGSYYVEKLLLKDSNIVIENKINGISDMNPNKQRYLDAADKES
jgi:hypothetical protein